MNSPDVDDLSTEAADFWFQIIRGVQMICQENEYYFNFESLTWRDPEGLVRRALSRLNDGAIVIPQYRRHYGFLSDLQSLGYPYVMYNPWVPVGDTHSVVAMDKEAQQEMTRYLVDKGRSSIAFVAGPPEHVDAQSRYNGYREGLLSAGLSPSEDSVFWSDFTMRGGYEAAKAILDSPTPVPDAIACANDYMAVGVIHALHDRGVRVPDDIAVTGFGDHDVGRSVIPRLTTVTLPTREIGAALGSKLFAQIHGESHSESTRFELALRIRESA
ncbi:MAG: substrate-binding domain-containing protein [Spirochaetales bacterium]|nr:substrate-binding domain-containing protein [Spirochaetales bacterium]